MKCVLYIYLIFITIIYGCINFYCLTSAHEKRNISKMDYTDVKNQMAFEISVS